MESQYQPCKTVLANSLLNSSAWQQFAEHMVAEYSLHVCHVMLINRDTMGLRYHVDAGERLPRELIEAYIQHHVHDDHLLDTVMHAPPGRFYTIDTLDNREQAYQSDHFQQWAKPQGLIDSAAACFLQDSNWMGLVVCNRHESVGKFTVNEIASLNDLYPNIVKAALQSFTIESHSTDSHRLQAVVETFRIPVAVLTEQGNLCAINQQMQALMDKLPDVSIENGCISLLDKQREKLLYISLILNAKKVEGYDVEISETDLVKVSKNVFLGFQPLMNNHLDDNSLFSGAMVYAISNELIKPIPAAKLAQIFGFTHRESLIAESIARGVATKTIADQQSISLNTVKFHIKNIFDKTGCSSQMTLMNLFNSIPHA